MADRSLIEWTDATWNPITGCTIVSPGCTNCYAMKLAGTRLKHNPARKGLTIDTKAGPVWNGQVRFNEAALLQPLKWRQPRMIFVCAHGDLFHESVPDDWIDRVFAVMALSPQHTFQVLTKRSERMKEYISRPHGFLTANNREDTAIERACWDLMSQHRNLPEALIKWSWPLPNVWLGVSAERQHEADARIPDLLATPAAIRFVSAEPLLGPIDFNHLHAIDANIEIDALRGTHGVLRPHQGKNSRLDWVIVGGESGRGSRPMHPEWVRSIREQCATGCTPFFFKQWGAWGPIEQCDTADEAAWQAKGEWRVLDKEGRSRSDGWPDQDRCEQAFVRIGKKAAGRTLDGAGYSGMPEVHERPFS